MVKVATKNKVTPTPLQPLIHPFFFKNNIQVWLKRDDLNHPIIQGNKLHKLKLNILQAKLLKKKLLISFGGAFSNHIAALSVAGKEADFKTLAFIRGDELANNPKNWSPTLTLAKQAGMEFVFLTRQEFRQKTQIDFIKNIKSTYPNCYIIPEGGTNALAIQGFAETMSHLSLQCPDWTHIYTAVGTGGTLAGISQYSNPTQKVFGISTLKNSSYLIPIIKSLTDKKNWWLLQDYHANGYAKSNEDLLASQKWFEQEFGVLLDPIYTNKMVHGFMQELKKGNIEKGSKIILYHSGGRQGRN